MVVETSARLGKMLEIIAKCQLKSLYRSSISHGFIMNVYNFFESEQAG